MQIRLCSALSCALGVSLLAGAASAQVCASETALLDASDGLSAQRFGWSVGATDDAMVVGQPAGDGVVAQAGAAYVYRRSGNGWVEEAKLMANDGKLFDDFGFSVDIYDDWIVVGATRGDGADIDSGAAYVFERDSTGTWNQVKKLQASDGGPNDAFGFSIAMDQRTVVVGARYDSHSAGVLAGAAYVYTRSGSTWSEQKLVASDAGSHDWFGYSVDVHDKRIVVGSRRDDDKGMNAGAAYVFRRQPLGWLEAAKLTASDGDSGDDFGWDVAIRQNVVLVSARGQPFGTCIGAGYVYRQTGTGWSEEAKLIASDQNTSDYLAESVALGDDVIALGARGCDDLGSDSGAAYVYRRSNGVWSEQTKLLASNGSAVDVLGRSVAFSQGEIVSGADQGDGPATNSGTIHVFDVAAPAAIYCVAKQNSQGCMPSIGYSGNPSASGATPFLVTATNVVNNRNGVLFYGVNGTSNLPYLGGTLCVKGPLKRTPLVHSGGSALPTHDCSGAPVFDFGAHLASGADPLLGAGVTVNGQFWLRDSKASFGTQLTDGIEFTVCP